MVASTFEIRKRFIDYFREKGHREMPSSPVVPYDDPSLLFINAGMNQFKDFFLGKAVPEFPRAVSSQKCIRVGGKHNDLENVGHTTRHLTFFEMLGNFSFGDYFKKEVIKYAWEISTEVFQFPEDKLFATVFLDDDEAFAMWEAYLPSSRIVRLGEEDNFWAMGDTGPCGPCSELLFDRGSEYGSARSPAEDTSGERFMEFWNLVFMQYNRASDGQMQPLPKPSIDTGAGLERLMVLIQDKDSIFEIDILRSLIASVEEVSGKSYEAGPKAPFQVIADHLRCLSFAIADGVQPSNTDRGYVLRKVLRRAVRYGKQLGIEKPFLGKLVPNLVSLMSDPYVELKKAENQIIEIVTVEEEAFLRTLRHGGNILSRVIEKTKEKGSVISGDDAFLLKDTYGLPLEEVELIAVDHELSIDTKRFGELEIEAKKRSKVARKGVSQVAESSVFEEILKESGQSIFLRAPTGSGSVVALIKDGKRVDTLHEGEEGMVILTETPFYAEGGGQIGDQGLLQTKKMQFIVTDTIRPFQGLFAHVGRLNKGALHVKDQVEGEIDQERRKKIEVNHTATHLLHKVLHEVLGEHARQSGSLVTDEHLRFDFCHHKAMSPEEIRKVEERVNELIRENYPAEGYELSFEEVQKRSDIKQIFGEKYGSVVRVLEMGPSKELCGGTHIARSGDIGYFRICKESSIAAGIRRIEAVTGEEAVVEGRKADLFIEEMANSFKVPPGKLQERLQKHVSDFKEMESQLKEMKKEKLRFVVSQLTASKSGDKTIVRGELPVSAKELKVAIEEVVHKHGRALVVLGCKDAHRAHILVKVPHHLVKEGFDAGKLLQKGLAIIEGNGGGKAELAQGAGPCLEKLGDAIETIIADV